MAVRTIEGLAELHALVGQEVGVSDWIEVTQAMITGFADVTGDQQWIHTDVERCQRESPFGTTIAHGFLSLALVSALLANAVKVNAGQKMAINYGLNRLRFPSPVRSGSKVRARVKLLGVDEFNGGVQNTWHVTLENEGSDKPALVAEWIGRMYL